jgi:hypothetical protein
LASGNGTAPTASRAERRRVEHNTPMPGGVGAAEHTLAQVIGETVAAHLAQMLGQLLPRMPWRPDCHWCVADARAQVHAYQLSVQAAQQAAEDNPEPPPPPTVRQAVTWMPVVQTAQGPSGPLPVACSLPACFEHVPAQSEGPKPTGLFAPDGRPIVRNGG